MFFNLDQVPNLTIASSIIPTVQGCAWSHHISRHHYYSLKNIGGNFFIFQPACARFCGQGHDVCSFHFAGSNCISSRPAHLLHEAMKVISICIRSRTSGDVSAALRILENLLGGGRATSRLAVASNCADCELVWNVMFGWWRIERR